MTPLLALAIPEAGAHEPGLSVARIDETGLTVTASARELDTLGLVSAEPLVRDLRLEVDGEPCTFGPPVLAVAENDGRSISLSMQCPQGEGWLYATPALSSLTPGHRQVVEAFGQPVAVLDAGNAEVRFEPRTEATEVGSDFLLLGVEHILAGTDHIAFLAALVLVARNLRQMLLIVTGFTLAHSITLSVAAFEILVLPPSLVEPAIGATIAWTGIENLWNPGPRRRFLLTFLMGLVHGFGFAGALAERGLPKEHTALALLSFNGGVELGQGALVALALPVLLLLRRWAFWPRMGVPAISLLIAAAGLYWLIERLL